MSNLIKDVFMQLIQDESKVYYQTGFRDLDSTCKIRGGDIVTIGGRPAMGKTEFSISILNSLLHNNHKVLYFSLDLPTNLIADRILKELSYRNNEKDIAPALNFYENKALYIEDSNISTDGIVTKIAEIKPNVAFIDYYQMLEINNETSFLKGLKKLAIENNIAIFLLSQISRKVEHRQNKYPLLADIKGSNILEDFSDIVLMLYREGYYDIKDETNRANVTILKNPTNYKNMVTLKYENGHFLNQPEFNY